MRGSPPSVPFRPTPWSLSSRKPSITEVVSRYTNLGRHGKQLVGLCPFHGDKTPSLSVNEDKGVFHCFGCGEGGDVFTFVQKIEGIDFKEALAHLGLDNQRRPNRAEIKERQILERASRNLTTWALDMAERVGSLMREVGQREYMATKVLNVLDSADMKFLQNEIERASREWIILTTLEQNLLNPNRLVDLWQEREMVEQFVGNSRTYSNEEIENRYYPLTDAYRKRLTRFVRGEA